MGRFTLSLRRERILQVELERFERGDFRGRMSFCEGEHTPGAEARFIGRAMRPEVKTSGYLICGGVEEGGRALPDTPPFRKGRERVGHPG